MTERPEGQPYVLGAGLPPVERLVNLTEHTVAVESLVTSPGGDDGAPVPSITNPPLMIVSYIQLPSRSKAAATASTPASSPRRPINCSPTGIPALSRPTGRAIAQSPR